MLCLGTVGLAKPISVIPSCVWYAELILKRKVSWCTYPTTKDKPLQLGWNVRDIPDLYLLDPLQARKVIEEVRNKSGRWSLPKRTAKKEVHGTADGVSHRHQDEKPIPVASVIATIFPNPTETNVPIIPNMDLGNTVKSSNDTKGKEVVDEGQVKVDNERITHTKAAGVGCSNPCSEDSGPSSLALAELQTSPQSPKNLDQSISDIMEMLKSMPNNESLKDLLDFSIKWTEGCSEK